ncbi:MAG: hypothetical protein ACI9EF_001687 [Pseudohongiellaceae bacterium]|jgi:hypothetical protein
MRSVNSMNLVCALGLLFALAGCTTPNDHRLFYSGRVSDEELLLREEMKAAEDTDRNRLRLELASVLQVGGKYSEAAELLSTADDSLEVLDYTSATIDDMAKFAFAVDDVWRASPPERLMINIQNMINFVGLGELDGAAVEARRLSILLSQSDLAEDDSYPSTFGWALAGIILAARGDLEEAQDAFAHVPVGSGLRPSADLAGKGTVLLVTQLGQAPIRRQVTYWLTDHNSPHPLNIPAMQSRPSGASSAAVVLDGTDFGTVPTLLDLEAQLMSRFKDELPLLVAAAAVQGGLRSAAAKEIIGDHNGVWAKFTRALAEVFLSSVQKADVRCWSLLAGRYGLMRLDVQPGTHELSVTLSGSAVPLKYSVEVGAEELVLVNVVSGPTDGFREYPEPKGSNVTNDPAGMKALESIEKWSHLHSQLR